jgi:hypothetical protein
MIVQQVPEGTPPIIICNVDHAVAAGQLAEAFGNLQGPFRMVSWSLSPGIMKRAGGRWMPIHSAIRRPACPII